MKLISKVTGITFRVKENDEIKTLRPKNAEVMFKHIPFIHPTIPMYNDANAVQVWIGKLFIGYLPKGSAEREAVIGAMKSGEDVKGKVVDYSYAEYDTNLNVIDGTWNDNHKGYIGSIVIEINVTQTSAHYEIDGEKYNRATKISGLLNTMEFVLPEFLWKWMAEPSYELYAKKMDRVTKKGTAIHKSAEDYLKTGIIEEDTPVGVVNYCKDYGIEPIEIEGLVKSVWHKVAGRFDLFAKGLIKAKNVKSPTPPACDRRGNIIVDWKSGKTMKIQYMLQLAFYSKMKKADGFTIVFLGGKNKCGYSAVSFTKKDIDILYAVFVQLAKIGKTLSQYKQFKALDK